MRLWWPVMSSLYGKTSSRPCTSWNSSISSSLFWMHTLWSVHAARTTLHSSFKSSTRKNCRRRNRPFKWPKTLSITFAEKQCSHYLERVLEDIEKMDMQNHRSNSTRGQTCHLLSKYNFWRPLHRDHCQAILLKRVWKGVGWYTLLAIAWNRSASGWSMTVGVLWELLSLCGYHLLHQEC